jgi:hypothetical protein
VAYADVVPLSNAEERERSQITFIADPGESDMFAVLVDGGAAGSTNYDRSKLHGYKALTVHKAFHDAGKRSHTSAGEGYIWLACGTSAEASNTYVNIHCFHTPTLPVTVLSPGRFVARIVLNVDTHAFMDWRTYPTSTSQALSVVSSCAVGRTLPPPPSLSVHHLLLSMHMRMMLIRSTI